MHCKLYLRLTFSSPGFKRIKIVDESRHNLTVLLGEYLMNYRGPAFSPSYDLAPSPIPSPLIRKFTFVKTSRNLQWQVKNTQNNNSAQANDPCRIPLHYSEVARIHHFLRPWLQKQLDGNSTGVIYIRTRSLWRKLPEKEKAWTGFHILLEFCKRSGRRWEENFCRFSSIDNGIR